MRVLKFLGITLLVLIVFLLFIGIFLPDTRQINQSIVMKAKPEVVFRQVNSLKNWKNWGPFELSDPSMKSVYSGPETGAGAKHTWTSANKGQGSMLILQSEPYKFIQSQLEMGSSGKAFDEWTFTQKGDSVEVNWTVKVHSLSYPFGKYFGAFLGSIMQPMQDKGLKKLKEVVESSPIPVPMDIVQLEEQPSIIVYDSTLYKNMSEFMQKCMTELMVFMKESKIQASGPAFTMYENWDTTTYIKMRIGFPVPDEVKERGVVSYYLRPGGPALKAVLIGPYEQLNRAHEEIALYFSEFKLPYSSLPVWEEYVTDPSKEPDQSKIQTNIFYYIGE
jgi:effector-binding domain-containing protein